MNAAAMGPIIDFAGASFHKFQLAGDLSTLTCSLSINDALVTEDWPMHDISYEMARFGDCTDSSNAEAEILCVRFLAGEWSTIASQLLT